MAGWRYLRGGLLSPCQLLVQAELGRAVDRTTRESAIPLPSNHLPAEKAQRMELPMTHRDQPRTRRRWPHQDKGVFCAEWRCEPLPRCFSRAAPNDSAINTSWKSKGASAGSGPGAPAAHCQLWDQSHSSSKHPGFVQLAVASWLIVSILLKP